MTVIGIIGDDLLHSVVLLRPDLPRIGTSLGGHGLCGSRRSKPSDNGVDGAAATGNHKHTIYHSVGSAWRDVGYVQLDLLPARAVRVDRVGARLAHCKISGIPRPKTITDVIDLCTVLERVNDFDTAGGRSLGSEFWFL